jgi:rhodanese-related sulfurtransferase
MDTNNKLIDVKSVYEELKNKTDSKIIDIRSPEEYSDKHIEKSINIPLERVESEVEKIIPDKNTMIYAFCRSGGRSFMAQAILESMGYKNIKNITGGILEWQERGLPLK